MRADPANPRWAASLLTAGGALVLGYFAFVEERRVPLFGWADLGVHELGHLLFMAAPDLVTANDSDDVSVLLNQGDGTGTFGAALSYAVGAQPGPLITADPRFINEKGEKP